MLVAAALAACAPSFEEIPESADVAVSTATTDEHAELLVEDPKVLQELERRGLSFGALLGVNGTTAKDMLASQRYRHIVETITRDLAEFRAADPESGVGFDFLHRQFDPKWLASPQARYELIAVVNRTDRMPINGCGDVRLLYRLAYTAKQSEGRLPMTLNFVFPQRNDGRGCATVARTWLDAKSGTADALLSGPLNGRAPLTWIDVNLQAVRWPSNARRTLGGQSEYILRTFGSFEPDVAENTPRLDLDDAEREKLRGWIRDNVKAIDEGTAIVPREFLTRRAISVGPLGLSRAANKAFSQLFPDAEKAFGDVSLSGLTQIASAAALVRRLDSMTCQGCHQARAIAGFHMLGQERDDDARLNALAVSASPHFREELPWRAAKLEAIADRKPGSSRPFAEHASTSGGYGQHCGLGDKGFASWTCAAGLECLDANGDVVGFCTPSHAPVGDACDVGAVTQKANPHVDTVLPQDRRVLSCDAAGPNTRCNAVSLGFPNGMCRSDCDAADSGKIDGATICGGIPSASGLTKCLTVERKPFKECLATTTNPALLRTCSKSDPCRDDYACMRVDGGPANIGACMPPYFAFQARVDGHMFDE